MSVDILQSRFMPLVSRESTKSGLAESYFGSQGLVLSGGSWKIGEESELKCGRYEAHADG